MSCNVERRAPIAGRSDLQGLRCGAAGAPAQAASQVYDVSQKSLALVGLDLLSRSTVTLQECVQGRQHTFMAGCLSVACLFCSERKLDYSPGAKPADLEARRELTADEVRIGLALEHSIPRRSTRGST